MLNCIEVEYVFTVGEQILRYCMLSGFSIAVENVIEDCSQKSYATIVKIQLFDCRLRHTWSSCCSEVCWEEGATSRASFKDNHPTLIQLKPEATMENGNECVYAVTSPAPSASVSHQQETDVWFGAYLKGNTLFLIAQYLCDEDFMCDDWQIVPSA